MPLDIDPEWEYFVGNPEVEEILAGSARAGGGRLDAIEGVFCTRLWQARALGIRFGKGDPNKFTGRLKPKRLCKPGREPSAVPDQSSCKTCNSRFRPKHDRHYYCSIRCAPKPGKPRELPDITCAQCAKIFRPRQNDSKYCSKKCVGESQRKVDIEHGCKNCGGDIPLSKSRNCAKIQRLYCSRKCKHAVINRTYRAKKREQKEQP